MRIGVDIDGVMYEWSKTARYLLREMLPNSPYTKDGPLGQESDSWDYIKSNVHPEHWRWLWSEGVKLGLFRHGHIVPGTIQGMRTLADKGHDLVIITHRPRTALRDTMQWLAFLDLPLSEVQILTDMRAKSLVTPQCDIYIDDKPENCRDYLDHTKALVVMYNQPWNRNTDWNLTAFGYWFQRVSSWPEFVKAVEEHEYYMMKMRGRG